MARNPEDRSQRGEETRGRRGATSPTNLDDRSIDELRDMARDLGIQGRDRLDRQQLIERIQTERESGEQGSSGPSREGTGEQRPR